MSWLRKYYVLKIVSLAMLACVVLACENDGDTFVDNSIAGSEGVGVNRFELALPSVSKLSSVLNYGSIILEMQGVSDMETYTIAATSSQRGDYIVLSSDDKAIKMLPHQAYHLNFISFPSSSDVTKAIFNDSRRLILGARFSMEDPNNITLTSTYNQEADCYGIGSEEDPISIVTVECLETQILDKLTAAQTEVALKGVHFRQTRSFNFALEYELFDSWTAAGKFNTGGYDVAFHGEYDGGRNTLRDISISTESSCALFYRLGDGAVIKNVQMDGVNFAGGYYAGAIACISQGDVTLENIDVHGTITGYGAIGGLIGSGNANFKDCYVNMTISGNHSTSIVFDNDDVAIGGFIGKAVGGDSSFNTCCYMGSINANDVHSAGGFIGEVATSAGDDTSDIDIGFTNCAVAGGIGNVIGDGYCNYVGGLIGYAYRGSNLTMDNVMIGSTIEVDTDDDSSESIFGDGEPIFSASTDCTITASTASTSYSAAGGYIGMLRSKSVVFEGYDNSVTKGCTITGSDYIGGVIGKTGDEQIAVDIKDKLGIYASFVSVSGAMSSSPYTHVSLGGFVGYTDDVAYTFISGAKAFCQPTSFDLIDGIYQGGSFAGCMTTKGVVSTFNDYKYNTTYADTKIWSKSYSEVSEFETID